MTTESFLSALNLFYLDERIYHKSSVRATHVPCSVDRILLFSFTLIVVSTFLYFVVFGSTNREASVTCYTRALPCLFVDASLLNENQLKQFSAFTF
jgi:hypothetical protein